MNRGMNSAQYCRKTTHRARSSFFLPFLFLAPQRRAAMYALYAFCREVDDIVDSDLPKEEARLRLDGWRQELRRAFAGDANHPVSIEVALYQRLFGLPTQPFYDILDGMEMDLTQNRYQTLDALAVYCHKVAVAVGRVAMRIFLQGSQEEDTLEATQKEKCHHAFAQHLGMALQLTNILRDVAEDAGMGRIYLPQQLLVETGVTEEDILHNRWNAPLAEAMRRLADVARHHYQAADTLITLPKERRKLRPAFLMAAIYQVHLQSLRHDHFNCFEPRPSLSVPSKLWILWRAWWYEKTRN